MPADKEPLNRCQFCGANPEEIPPSCPHCGGDHKTISEGLNRPESSDRFLYQVRSVVWWNSAAESMRNWTRRAPRRIPAQTDQVAQDAPNAPAGPADAQKEER